MRAFVIQADNSLKIVEKEVPTLKVGKALIKIRAAALNRRDVWIQEGKYPNITAGSTIGSDGAGVVVAVGAKEHNSWLDRPVLLNPNIDWGPDPRVQSSDYTILGMPVDGTLADYVVADVDRLHSPPKHLSLVQASSLPLAGLTAYRALFRYADVSEKTNVFISGFGGGVAQFAGLFALATGANVYISSSQSEVRDRALKLGAKAAVDYREKDYLDKLLSIAGGMDLVIDSAGGDQFNDFIKILRPAGRIVFYGATNGLPQKINLHQLFWKQGTIQGTSMGNDEEFVEMLRFVEDHQIEPIIGSTVPFEKIYESLEQMASGALVGKSVLTFEE